MKQIFRLLLMLIFGATTAGAQVNLTSGLVAYYPFNGNANDASGNNNNGTPSGSAALITDQWGNPSSAYNFNGTNGAGQITIPNSPTLQFTTSASFAFWVKLNSNVGTNGFGNIVAGGQHCFFAKEGDAGGGLFALTSLNGSTLTSSVGNVSMTNNNSTLTGYSVGQWIHFCYVMDATETRVYINGNLVSTQAGAPSFTTMNTKNLYLARFGTNWYPMNGALDEFRVYNRVLNTAEISALASNTAATLAVTNVNPTTICAGSPISVDITSSGVSAGNVYTVQLSDPSGSFTYPVNIGTLTSSAATATINCVIPQAVASGTGYKVRVQSNLPTAASAASTQTITVNSVIGDIPNAAQFRYIGSTNGNDYFVSLVSQVWLTAQSTCVASGGNLASIPDAATNNLLKSFTTTLGAHIGFSDAAVEGTFVWPNGAPVTFTSWNAGEPNNSGNEDYSQMGMTGLWNDINNAYSSPFFMQLAPATSNSPVCEGGPITLNGVALAGATYSWTGPNSFSSSLQNPVIPSASLAAAGTYTLTYTKNGCTGTATVNVVVNQSPNAVGATATLPASLSTGLLLYYPMNGNANDASGNSLNGVTNAGVSAAIDRFGYANAALKCNGTNGYIDAADANYFTGTDFTISAWVKVGAYATWSRLMDFGNGPGNNNVLIGLTNGTTGRPAAEIYINAATGGQITSPSTQLPLNQWALVTWSWSAGTGRLYINGTQQVQGAQTSPVNVLRTLNYIGRSNWAGDAYANATFDDFRIYNRLLSTSEMRALLMEQPDPMAVIAMPAAICPSTASSIKVIGSQFGVTYQLQNAGTGTNIGSAQGGNGDTLSFATGTLSATTSFQIVATGAGSCQQIIGPITVSIITPASAPATTGATRCNPGSVTLNATGAPNGAIYNWYTASTGGTPFFTGPSYTTPTISVTTTYYVSIMAGTCESNRTPVTATINLPTAPAVDIYNGLIAYWKFDGNQADSSGRGNHLSPMFVANYDNDRFGTPNKAGAFAGGVYASAGNPGDFQAPLGNAMSLSMWIKENPGNYGYTAPLVNKWQNDGFYSGLDSYYDLNVNQQMNRVRWRVNAGYYAESSVNVPHSQWVHVVCTYNGSRLKIYQNGVLTADVFATGVVTNTIVNVEIGRQANGLGSTTYDGDIDEVRVYNRALNADEAMTLYNDYSVAFANAPICAGQTLQLSAPAITGATYTWNGPNGFSSSQATPPAIPNATSAVAGTYTLVINNPNGCSTTPQTNTVVVNPLPVAPTAVGDTVCGSGNAVLTASGGSSYAWYADANSSTVLGSSATYTINNISATDTLYVSAISSSGCEGPRTPVIAKFNNPIQTNLTAQGSTICSGTTTTTVTVQNSQSGISYTALYNNNPVSSAVNGNGGTITLTVNTGTMGSGNNSITIAATQTGCGTLNLSDTATVRINVPATPTISASGPTSFCTGGSVTLTASNGNTYLWSNGPATNSITVNQSGTYSVTVTDANGCMATSAGTTVSAVNVPSAGINVTGPTTFCQGGSVTLTATGGSTYLWSNSSTLSSISITQSGTYSVIATNGGSCSDTSSAVTVTVLPAPNASITAAGPVNFCQGGSVTLNATGGGTYLWSNNSTANSITVNQGGNYSTTVTGANGCTATSNVITVTVNNNPTASISASGPLTFCAGDDVTLYASGGTTYQWSDGSFFSSNTISQSGSYYVIAMNSSSCTDTSAVVNVVVNPLPNVTFTVTPDTFCVMGPAVTLTGGSPAGGTYSGWGVTGNSFDPQMAGLGDIDLYYDYTDANGCANSATYWVYVDLCLDVASTNAVVEPATLMPNPAADQTTLRWSEKQTVTRVDMIDVTGRLVRSYVPDGHALTIDVTDLSTGVYTLRISGDLPQSLRFVKE